MTDSISQAAFNTLVLLQTTGVGPGTVRKLASKLDFNLSKEDFAAQALHALVALSRKPPAENKAVNDLKLNQERYFDAAFKEAEEASRRSCKILCLKDQDYPLRLSACRVDPTVLYVMGSPAVLQTERAAAVIGTREPTAHGSEITKRVTQALCAEHFAVISGLARGCDGLAHQTALACGGLTAAILGHGLAYLYPKEHEQLAADIVSAGGALVTQFPYHCPPEGRNFAARDLIQAGTADFVALMQSKLGGGSLIASFTALSLHRPLAVIQPTRQDLTLNPEQVAANAAFCAFAQNHAYEEFMQVFHKKPADCAAAEKLLFILKSKADYQQFAALSRLGQESFGGLHGRL